MVSSRPDHSTGVATGGLGGSGLGGSGLGGSGLGDSGGMDAADGVGVGGVGSGGASQLLQLYDLKNKYIGYSAELPSHVRWVVSCGGRILVYTHHGMLLTLVEKDWDTKLASLYRKHLYSTALSLASSRGCSRAAVRSPSLLLLGPPPLRHSSVPLSAPADRPRLHSLSGRAPSRPVRYDAT